MPSFNPEHHQHKEKSNLQFHFHPAKTVRKVVFTKNKNWKFPFFLKKKMFFLKKKIEISKLKIWTGYPQVAILYDDHFTGKTMASSRSSLDDMKLLFGQAWKKLFLQQLHGILQESEILQATGFFKQAEFFKPADFFKQAEFFTNFQFCSGTNLDLILRTEFLLQKW